MQVSEPEVCALDHRKGDHIISHVGFGPLVVRDVAQLHTTVSPVESVALAKDVFRWLQANGGYLVEHPE